MADEIYSSLSEKETAELRWAYQILEHPSLAARLSNVLASPIGEGLSLLPKRGQQRLRKTGETIIYRLLKVAVSSMSKASNPSAQRWLHGVLAMGAGAAGGFFGPLALAAELPVTTALLLRSIADIARSEGEDLRRKEARIACLNVFGLGGRTKEDEAADVGYYGLRVTLGLHFERDIIEYAGHAKGPHIPAFVELTRAVVARFGVVISDKAAAQMVPLAGAVTGAALNLIFMKHYQDVARGHFVVRRLERRHGEEAIRCLYRRLADEEAEEEKAFSPVEGW